MINVDRECEYPGSGTQKVCSRKKPGLVIQGSFSEAPELPMLRRPVKQLPKNSFMCIAMRESPQAQPGDRPSIGTIAKPAVSNSAPSAKTDHGQDRLPHT
jgi:hypothetical protein